MVNGKKIRELREAAGLTVTDFAGKICVSQSFASYMELGMRQPKLETLICIADYFGVTVDDLLVKDSA